MKLGGRAFLDTLGCINIGSQTVAMLFNWRCGGLAICKLLTVITVSMKVIIYWWFHATNWHC